MTEIETRRLHETTAMNRASGGIARLFSGLGPRIVLAPEGGGSGAAETDKGADKGADTATDKTVADDATGKDTGKTGNDGDGKKEVPKDSDGGVDGGMLLKGSKTAEAESKDGEEKKDGEGAEKKEGDGEKLTGAPEAYADFAMPEGMEVDTTALEAFAPEFKDLDLSQEQAQKLVTRYAEQKKVEAAAAAESWKTIQTDWIKAARSDKEYGGAAFEQNMTIANKALDQFGDKDLVEALEMSGMGNHPAMVRFFVKAGKALGEDTADKGAGAGQGADIPTEQRLYGNTTPPSKRT